MTATVDTHDDRSLRPRRGDGDDDSSNTTVLPLTLPMRAPAAPRPIGKLGREDMLVTLGAGVSALSTTLLLFGRLTPMSGLVGFFAVFLMTFVAIYALLVSLTNDRPAVVDRVMAVLFSAAALLAGSALVWVVVSTVWNGRKALVKWNTYVDDMSSAGPLEPLSVGGIAHALVGTLVIMAIALLITVPLGILCAVFLNETRGRFTQLVRTIVTAMTALPSVLAGLFILATWILILGYPRSGLAAAISISIMMLPIIIRSGDVVLRLVQGNLREASAALGASAWRTAWHVVLPTARSGLATSVILGVARGIGETAPVLLTSGVSQTMNTNPTKNSMMSLPLATYEFIRAPQPTLVARGFASAAVLMIVVLVLFTTARVLGGRPAGRLSKRQARRAAARSKRDLQRFESRLRGAD